MLCKHDLETAGDVIRQLFIKEFTTKNRPFISVLAKNGLPIVFDASSDVQLDDFQPRLPSKIVRAIADLRAGTQPLAALTGEVRSWLSALRYEVADWHYGPRSADAIATLSQGIPLCRGKTSPLLRGLPP